MAAFWPLVPMECPAVHPKVEGPCVDIAQCQQCGTPMGVLRPPGETWGRHIDDCCLPERHYGYCLPGGKGHPVGKVRGV